MKTNEEFEDMPDEIKAAILTGFGCAVVIAAFLAIVALISFLC